MHPHTPTHTPPPQKYGCSIAATRIFTFEVSLSLFSQPAEFKVVFQLSACTPPLNMHDAANFQRICRVCRGFHPDLDGGCPALGASPAFIL